MWYCLQGSDIQPGDGNFIKKLLEVYTTYSIPIIFVHTQTYSIRQSNTCKSGVEKYLQEIYKNDNNKVQEHLNNYITTKLFSITLFRALLNRIFGEG